MCELNKNDKQYLKYFGSSNDILIGIYALVLCVFCWGNSWDEGTGFLGTGITYIMVLYTFCTSAFLSNKYLGMSDGGKKINGFCIYNYLPVSMKDVVKLKIWQVVNYEIKVGVALVIGRIIFFLLLNKKIMTWNFFREPVMILLLVFIFSVSIIFIQFIRYLNKELN